MAWMKERFRTWLFTVSISVAILGVSSAAIANRMIDSSLDADSFVKYQVMSLHTGQMECVPAISQNMLANLDRLIVTRHDDLLVSLKMGWLFTVDQSARRLPVFYDPENLLEEDAQRRIEVLGYLAEERLHSAKNLVYAAYIFQHGSCSDHYLLANRLAQLAMDAGDTDARWLYAATLDRYLMSRGEPQKFGTQYVWVGGTYELYLFDPQTTDVERLKFNIHPLDDANHPKPAGAAKFQRRWLETWWFTLIGMVYTFLSAFIGVADKERNAILGRIALAVAVIIFPASIVGHYMQVVAIFNGVAQTQQRIWTIINGCAALLWCVIFLLEITGRFMKKPFEYY